MRFLLQICCYIIQFGEEKFMILIHKRIYLTLNYKKIDLT